MHIEPHVECYGHEKRTNTYSCNSRIYGARFNNNNEDKSNILELICV